MRRASFLHSLGFAALAGALALPVELYGARSWGYEGSLARYMLALVPLCMLATLPGARARLRGALAGAGLGLALACTDPAPGSALLGCLVSLGLARTLALGARSFARTLAAELGLALLSALPFAALSGSDLGGDAFAVWSFWLVQSAHALLPLAPVASEPATGDRFEAARTAAERLLTGA